MSSVFFPFSLTPSYLSGLLVLSHKFRSLVCSSTIKWRLVISNYLTDNSTWISSGYLASCMFKSEFQSFLAILFISSLPLVISKFNFQVAQANTPDSPLFLFFFHCTSNIPANSVSSTSKILPDFFKVIDMSITNTLVQATYHHLLPVLLQQLPNFLLYFTITLCSLFQT